MKSDILMITRSLTFHRICVRPQSEKSPKVKVRRLLVLQRRIKNFTTVRVYSFTNSLERNLETKVSQNVQ